MKQHRAIFAGSMLFSILAGFQLSVSDAKAQACQLDLPAPRVSVQTYEGPIKINNGHSSKQLAAKIGKHGTLSRNSGWVTRGLTKTALESRLKLACNSGSWQITGFVSVCKK